MPNQRFESDYLGELSLPADALYGIHTRRALINFCANETVKRAGEYPSLVGALLAIKAASAKANAKDLRIEKKMANAIVIATKRALNSDLPTLFPIPIIQGGGGTSLNMNANEVVANIANEELGGARGRYSPVCPFNTVNCRQSTNDVIPTATRIAARVSIKDCSDRLSDLSFAISTTLKAFADMPRVIRTCWRDAITGDFATLFGGMSAAIQSATSNLKLSSEALRDLPIGGGVAGATEYVDREFGQSVLNFLQADFDFGEMRLCKSFSEAAQDPSPLVAVSDALDRVSRLVFKQCQDLRILSSGPDAGIAEIELAPVQVGSSAMPCKENPVLPEYAMQCCLLVQGHAAAARSTIDHGDTDLNVWELLTYVSVVDAANLLAIAAEALKQCFATLHPIKAQSAKAGELKASKTYKQSLAEGYLQTEHLITKQPKP
ncbi:Aspartate ammonia-lyase [Stieleria neptunia]|uniref:Aspartate ammonia-lyase n=1 Tax=Stieleria neptunia TaxID=2527979 RepID=A0A518HII6_9BACT|nr:lyase family protein [Stieleria neptunia]QDV40675.1 Aspartate ammonia-lyase [Stieleria neptunia]